MMGKKRSKGIILFGYALLLWGIYGTFFLNTYCKSPYFTTIDYSSIASISQKIAATIYHWYHPVTCLLIIPLNIILGIGLIMFKAWSRTLLLAVCFYQVLYFFLWIILIATSSISALSVVVKPSNFTNFIGGLILPILLIYIFTRPKVKEQFK